MGAVLSMVGRTLGTAAGAGLAVVWIYAIWFPDDALVITGVSVLIAGFMAVLALAAAIAASKGHAVVIFVVFVASFLPIGASLLWVAHWFQVVGALDCVLLLAGVMIWLGNWLRRART